MICPVEIASEVSAWQAARVGEHGRHVLLHAGRDGADDESTGSDSACPGEEDHVVAGGRDHRDQRPTDAALASATRSSAMTDCLIGGVGSLLPSEGGWRWWSRCWGCTASAITI